MPEFELIADGLGFPEGPVVMADGWTAESIASDLLPALTPSFYPNDVSADIFPWDPI